MGRLEVATGIESNHRSAHGLSEARHPNVHVRRVKRNGDHEAADADAGGDDGATTRRHAAMVCLPLNVQPDGNTNDVAAHVPAAVVVLKLPVTSLLLALFIMEAIFEVVSALAKAIGYLLLYIFEFVCEVVCLPMMIVALVTLVHASDIKFDSDRWERRGSTFVAFWHLIFDICIFLPT